MIFSQEEDQPGTHSTPAEIALKLNIDRRSVSRITDQDFDLCPSRKRKVQKLTDSKIEKHSRKSVQESYSESVLIKHYKLHSLLTKKYLN